MQNCGLVPRGTGVADAIGNWGFSNKISRAGNELSRLRCLFNKIDSLRSTKPVMCVKYNSIYDPEAWYIKPSPEKCKPIWNVPMKRPLITYSSTAYVHITANLNTIGSDLHYPIPGRSYAVQGTDKWYRFRNECSPQVHCCSPCPPRCA